MTQILIIQDLGIEKIIVENLFSTLIPSAQIIYGLDDQNMNSKKVHIIITIKEKIDESLLKQFPNTQLIAVAFTGYDAVDVAFCTQNNISVCNVPSYATDAVAELTIGLAISLLRDIPKTNQLLLNGGWNYKAGQELKGKTVGIVGTGAIGIRVAELFKAFGCKIVAWSRSKNSNFEKLGGIYVDNLNKLCSSVDILTLHIPFNEATKNLINTEQLNLMKPTAFLINTARGPVVNEKALTKALNDKTIAGAAIDVFDIEPISTNNHLKSTENSILTPHIAYKTEEALLRRASITVDNIKNFLEENTINKVN